MPVSSPTGFSTATLLGSTAGLAVGDPVKALPGTGRSVPGGIESVLEYNGIYLNVREWIDTYLVTNIGGIDDADVRDTREVNPGYHGETAYISYYGGRTITLTGKIVAKSLFKLRDMQKGLRQAFSQLDQELPLIFRTPDPNLDMMIYCKKSQSIQMAEEQRTANHFERSFLITLRASNPRFLSVSEIYNTTKFSDLSDFGLPDPVTTETFDSPGIFGQYNERGHGFVISGGKLTYDTSLPADNFLNLIAEPDFEEIDYQNFPTTIKTTNCALTVANSGGALNNGKHGVLKSSVAAPFISARWDVAATPGAYSAIGYMRSPFRSHPAWLMVEWLNAADQVLGSQYSEITTTGAWQEVRLLGAIAPAGTTKSRWHLRFNFVDANEEHHVDKMLVVRSSVLPPEGYFDGSDALADWTDSATLPSLGSTSKQPRYSILTTSRSFENVMQVVKFTTPATLPTPRVGEIRLVMSYLDDNNYIYAYIGETGAAPGAPPAGRLYMGLKQVLNGVDEFADVASGDFALDPNTTYWMIGYIKDDVIHGEITDVDPYTRTVAYNNIDHTAGFLFYLTPELKTLYKSQTPMQLVTMEKGARIPIDEWTYQSLDAPSGWEHKYPVNYNRHDTIWVRNGRLLPLGTAGPLLVRNDLSYDVENGRISAKLRHTGIPTDLNIKWGIAVKVLDPEIFISAQIEYTNTTPPTINLRMARWLAATPFGSALIAPSVVTPADFPANTDAWISIVINGDQFRLEFWKTDPSLGGAATVTNGPVTLTSTNKTTFGAGIKGQIGILYEAPKAAKALSIDDFRIEQQIFSDIAFIASNDGNFRAQPEIHLIGPMVNPVIVNEANDDWMSIITTVPNGEEWIIDIAEHRMYRRSDGANRFQYLDANSDWLELEPGDNQISLAATGMTATSQMDMRSHHTVM
jgi:Siphovirus-type tail component, C-terminal domain